MQYHLVRGPLGSNYAADRRRMAETKFWAIYFRLVRDLLDSAPPPSAEPSRPLQHDRPVASTSHGKSQQTTPSAMSAWEDVEAPSAEGSHDRRALPAAEPEAAQDDLDEYLKVLLCAALHALLHALPINSTQTPIGMHA